MLINVKIESFQPTSFLLNIMFDTLFIIIFIIIILLKFLFHDLLGNNFFQEI